jgi:hypothetical protein
VVTTRASIIIWSAGSGLLLGLFIDAAVIGVWLVLSSLVPNLAPRFFPRWAAALSVVLLGAVPLFAATLGFLEGRLKAS